MSECPSWRPQTEGDSGSPVKKSSVFKRLWLGILALVAAAAGLLLVWVLWPREPTPPARPADTPSGTPVSPPPEISPAQRLGLSPELPTTAQEFNREVFEICGRLVSELPERPEAHAVAALVFNRHGRTAEAAEHWQKALEVNSRFAPAYYGLGFMAADKGELDKATELLRHALELDPRLASAYSSLVDVLLRQGKANAAMEVAQEYVKRYPKSGDSQYWLGQTYLDLGQYEEAKRSHQMAIGFDPTYTRAYYSLAIACSRLKERDKARQYREKFAELKEKDLQEDRGRSRDYLDLPTQQRLAASYHLAAGNVHAAFGDPQKAEAHWLRGAAVAPKLTACREALVAFYEQHDRPVAALGQLEALLALEPRNAVYWARRGSVEAGLEQLDAAEDAFRKAIQIAPEAAEAYLALVELHLQSRRRLPDVVALAEKGASLAPSGRAYLMLSAARDKSGDRAGAISAAKQALKLEPENRQLQEVYERLQQSNP